MIFWTARMTEVLHLGPIEPGKQLIVDPDIRETLRTGEHIVTFRYGVGGVYIGCSCGRKTTSGVVGIIDAHGPYYGCDTPDYTVAFRAEASANIHMIHYCPQNPLFDPFKKANGHTTQKARYSYGRDVIKTGNVVV